MPDLPAGGRRLRPGHHLFRGGDGGWRLWEPGDRFTAVRGPDDVLAAVARRVAGGEDVAVAGTELHLVAELESALEARGVLAPAAVGGPRDPHWTVVVAGHNPIGQATAQLLEPFADVRRLEDVDERDVREADTVVTCAGWLPDTRWQEIDSWCAQHRTDWHMSHVEGTTHYLGPMHVPGVTASYRDTRARRLAAASRPDELRALWSSLDDGLRGRVPLPPVPWPDGPGVAAVAGLLAGDLLARHRTGRPASAGHQLAVDVASATLVRHPVLRLPRTASAQACRAAVPHPDGPAAGRSR